MEKLYSNIIGSFIFEDDEQRPFTTVKDLVLDTEKKGALLALIVDVRRNLIISPIDIVSWHQNVIKVHSGTDLVEGSEVLRVAEVQEKGAILYNNKVFTKAGEYLGRVYDMAIDGNTLNLRKIFVTKSILGMVRYQSRIILVQDILEVLPKKVVVKNNLSTVKEPVSREVSVEEMALS